MNKHTCFTGKTEKLFYEDAPLFGVAWFEDYITFG
jgi:hypothetical protein